MGPLESYQWREEGPITLAYICNRPFKGYLQLIYKVLYALADQAKKDDIMIITYI